MPQTISSDISVGRQVDLEGQHVAANLDVADLVHLDTPGDRKAPTKVRGVSID